MGCTTAFDPAVDDVYRLEGQGPGFTAITQAPLMRVLFDDAATYKHLLELKLIQKFQVVQNNEDPRRLADGESVVIRQIDHTTSGELLDVSTRGFGILCREPIAVGAWAEIEIRSGLGLVEGKAITRNCQRLADAPSDLFRVGFELVTLNRMDALRWGRLMRAA